VRAVARWWWAPLAVLLLTSCGALDDFLGQMPCSFYNGDLDEFRLSVAPSEAIVTLGGSLALAVERSWLDDQLRRRPLSCTLAWVVDPAGLASVDADDVLAVQATGVGTVTARVPGSGGVKQSTMLLAVTPSVTEVEPNNGVPAANLLGDGATLVGRRDYDGDVDWFRTTLPAGASVQFTLTPSIALHGSWYLGLTGTIFAADGTTWLGVANSTYTNNTGVVRDTRCAPTSCRDLDR